MNGYDVVNPVGACTEGVRKELDHLQGQGEKRPEHSKHGCQVLPFSPIPSALGKPLDDIPKAATKRLASGKLEKNATPERDPSPLRRLRGRVTRDHLALVRKRSSKALDVTESASLSGKRRRAVTSVGHGGTDGIKDLEVFAGTQEVKVDPDKPLEGVRLLALQSKKTLLVPTPRLRTGLFNKITPPPGATKEILRKCATSQGVRDFSVPVSLDSSVLVDLIVVGSVAVSEKGWRIGKGEGYADLEYAMMVSMGAVHEGTPVITIVHDCQVIDIPEALLEDHDLTVDYIITPTRVIATGCARPKPTGIIWSKVVAPASLVLLWATNTAGLQDPGALLIPPCCQAPESLGHPRFLLGTAAEMFRQADL
ncbi:hypothetical protein STEG23_029522, partial [Scotinomys teguina]